MIQQKFPEPTVGALVLNPEGELLLVKSHKWKDCYTVPGGHIEVGETLEEALIREVKEETGLAVTDLEFICFHEFIADPAFWETRHFIFFDFICRTESLSVRLNDEAQEYLWVPLDRALDFPIGKYLTRTLKIYLNGNPNPLDQFG